MNPYYSKEELESFEYKNAGNNIYEKDHIMRLRQATTNYWKEKFARFGKEIIYLEFEYPWQEWNEPSVCLPELKVPEDCSKKPDTERECPGFTRCARRRTLHIDIRFWENVLFLTAIFPDHFQKILACCGRYRFFLIGGDGEAVRAGLWPLEKQRARFPVYWFSWWK